MDPISQTLLSITVCRAGFDRLTRLAMPMLIVSGLAVDLDLLSAIGGPRAYLEGRCTATHSFLGASIIAAVVALAFTLAGRKHATEPIRFARAFTVCLAGALIHIALEFAGSYGVKLFWPFSGRWFALDLIAPIDPWLIVFLLAGILLPALFRLITEEIGAKHKSRSIARGAIAALALLVIYLGGREVLHMRALQMLNSRLYRGDPPITMGAFPDSTSPFKWYGVVVTENALIRVDVPILGSQFDPESGRPYFKPEPSAALEAARATPTASLFLSFARFPRAHIEQTDAGYHVEITDLRFDVHSPPGRVTSAVIDLTPQAQITKEELKMDSPWWH
ncbi:MAG: metal-dependent hydrolase [Candidatus Acidiferrales bacterium]